MRTRKRTNNIWTIQTKELQVLFDTLPTKVQILKVILKTQKTPHGSYCSMLNKIDLKIFNQTQITILPSNTISAAKINEYDDTICFCQNSKIDRKSIKNKIIKRNLIPYVCFNCLNNGQWQGKKLSLQLDHINGKNNDHRLQNLRFACPNCHSQTQTYSKKNVKTINTASLCQCGNSMYKKSKRCKNCQSKNRQGISRHRQFNLSKQELMLMMQIHCYNFESVGNKLNVSRDLIRKKCKQFGIYSELLIQKKRTII